MIRWIIRSSLKLRIVVVAIAVLLLVFGFSQLEQLPVDTLPEFSRPFVEIQTEALGLSAEEVEAMITTPMEADMLNGTPWVEEIRSVSLPGLSSIVLVFEKGTDIIRARQVVQERLTEVFALPNVSKPPVMINPVSSAGRCMVVGLRSDKLSLIEMSVLARWTIVPRLMGLPGVANVSIWGERERQLQVQVDPERLRNERISLMQIIKTAGNSLWASPLSFLEASTPGTGGWIDTPNQRLGIRHILPIKTAEDLSKVVVEGAPTKRLGDVATVVEDHQPLIGDAIFFNAPSLMLVIEKFPWANTMEVTEEVEEALAALQPGLSGLEMNTSFFRPATFLELAVENLLTALLMSGALMLLVLMAFLKNWRAALIITATILVSVVAALTILYIRGTTLNMMTIAGLIIALGLIIDDAVVSMETILRRLRESREKSGWKAMTSLIYEASVEMRTPVLYATVIIVIAIVPILFLEGVSGAFWHPVALSYMLALLVSFLVSLTLVPALSLLILGNSPVKGSGSASQSRRQRIYDATITWGTRAPRTAFTVLCAIMIAGLLSVPFLRQESLLPDFKETDLVVRWEGSSSASHPSMSRIITLASQQIRSIPGVRNVSAHLGRAIMSDKRSNINAAELWVTIDALADYDATVAAVKQAVADYPGLSPEVLTNLQARVREELSGTKESPIVRVYGENMKMIRRKAEEVQTILAMTSGVVDAHVQFPKEMPTVEIEVDIERAKRFGLKPGDVRRAATTLVSGLEVGSLFEEQKVFNVIVLGEPKVRHSLTSIQELLIDTPVGGHVRLGEVAEVRILPSATAIQRDAVARYMDVTANVQDRDLAAVAADVERGIRGMDFPLEYRAELLGEYAVLLAAKQRVLAFAIAAAIGILLIVQAFFRSWTLAIIFFLSLPMALAGCVLAVFSVHGGILSFGSILGFIAVLGIAARNGIVLVSHYRRLQSGSEEVTADLIKRATQERSAPVLMTTLTTAITMVPFVVLGDIAGLEIAHPMAVTLLGGLVSSTLFTLGGVPAISILFGTHREPELELAPSPAGEMSEVIP